MPKKKIFIASDHAGFELKGKLALWLKGRGYEVEDLGSYSYDPGDDYPDFISRVAHEVSGNPENSLGIVMGGSGQGEAIVCNRFPRVRAAIFYGSVLAKGPIDINGNASNDPFEIIKLERAHNDANVLSLAARFISEDEAKEAVGVWLETSFSGDERHVRRIKKIEGLKC